MRYVYFGQYNVACVLVEGVAYVYGDVWCSILDLMVTFIMISK